jgi:hypothetical protein
MGTEGTIHSSSPWSMTAPRARAHTGRKRGMRPGVPELRVLFGNSIELRPPVILTGCKPLWLSASP